MISYLHLFISMNTLKDIKDSTKTERLASTNSYWVAVSDVVATRERRGLGEIRTYPNMSAHSLRGR